MQEVLRTFPKRTQGEARCRGDRVAYSVATPVHRSFGCSLHPRCNAAVVHLGPRCLGRLCYDHQSQPGGRANHPRTRRAIISAPRWHPVVANNAAAHHAAGGDATAALPYHLERTGPIVLAIASAPRADGAFRRQYRVTREQRLQAEVGVGSRSARGRTQRVCCSAGGVQDAPRARRDSERRRVVSDPSATRPGSGVGVSLPRQAGGNDEQYRVAASAKGSRSSARAHS